MATLAAIADVISAVEVAGVDLESCEYDGSQFTIPMDGLDEEESGELADALADLGVEGDAGVFSFLDESEDADTEDMESEGDDIDEYADEDFVEEDPEDDEDDFDDEDNLEGDDPEDF